MQEASKSDGSEYWKYLLLYTNDCLVIHENPEMVLRHEIGKYFQMKELSIDPPEIDFGGIVRSKNQYRHWVFSSFQYVWRE